MLKISLPSTTVPGTAAPGTALGTVAPGTAAQRADLLAVEEPLEIRIGGTPLTVTMRTPGDDIDLAAGFLFGEGLIDPAATCRDPDVRRERGRRHAGGRHRPRDVEPGHRRPPRSGTS